MNFTTHKKDRVLKAVQLKFRDNCFEIIFDDQRSLIVPYKNIPSLSKATKEQRQNAEIIGLGTGIHWPQLDEDLSVEGLLYGAKIKA